LAAVVAAVTGATGVLLDPQVRHRLLRGEALDGPLGVLADAVGDGGLGVTAGHVQALHEAGYGEDAIFECIVAAAVGAGVRRVRAVEELLGIRS
jgi:hypothetical protein